MSFEYHREGNTVEIIIRESSGAKIETHKCNIKDRKKYWKILSYLKDKYGFQPEIDAEHSVNKVDWFGCDF